MPTRPTSSTAHPSPEEANSFWNEFACHTRPPPCPCRPDPEVGRMKRLTFLRAAAVAGALATTPFPAVAAVRAVWAVTDGEKIAHDARDHPLHARNAAWDGRTVRLFAARNEVVAFQVIVEADERGIGAASLALPDLRLRGGATRIAYAAPEADPTRSVGRPI